jgi:hypothetical protein
MRRNLGDLTMGGGGDLLPEREIPTISISGSEYEWY